MSAGVCVRYKKKIKYRPIVGRGCLLIFLFSGPSLFLLGFLEIRVLSFCLGENCGTVGGKSSLQGCQYWN